jgi:ribosomal protein L16 Arg81 hydroxylase
MKESPRGVADDGTFPVSVITKALSRGESVVFRYAHQWSAGAAAVIDAIGTSFRRRANINAYVTGAGFGKAMDAHNDAHCFVIVQVSGQKHWSIWTREDKMLPMPEVTCCSTVNTLAFPSLPRLFRSQLYAAQVWW